MTRKGKLTKILEHPHFIILNKVNNLRLLTLTYSFQFLAYFEKREPLDLYPYKDDNTKLNDKY
jgi:hypothetical protein